MSCPVRVSRGLYKMLLFAYPRQFRVRFKSEMVSTFSALISGKWEQKGLVGVARVWRGVLGELFSVAVPLNLQSPIVITISLASLSSFALFMTVFHAMTHLCDSK